MTRTSINLHLTTHLSTQPTPDALTQLKNALVKFFAAKERGDMGEARRLAGVIKSLRKEVGE